MANWTILKEAIAYAIKTNGNQEITGQLLQNILNNIVSSVGENATFAGIATPTTNPGVYDGPVFYIAAQAGTYSNFNGIEVAEGEAVIFKWNNGTWTKKTTGLATEQEIIYDISARNGGVIFESLSALLSSSNLSTLIPTSVRCGGMSIRFIQSFAPNSDNKYVQYRLMSDTFNTTVANWQGVDDEPTAGSDNLVKSGGVFTDVINTALINASEITDTELSLAETLPLIPAKYRKGLAFVTIRDGSSNNLALYGFVSRNPTDANWNNVNNWRKFAREDKVNTLIAEIAETESGLATDIKNTEVIDINNITNQEPQSLEDALPLVPAKFRKGFAIIYFRAGGVLQMYGFISVNPNETNWNNTNYWVKWPNINEVNSLISSKIKSLPNMVISYRNTSGVFYVYMRKPGTNIYFMLDLHHVVNNDELMYLNIWRLRGEGQLCKYENGQFVNLNKNLLLGVENEFTMLFGGAADFTGGYHGDERIDTDGSFCKFFVDGKELTPTQLSEDFTIECSNFYMLSNATLHETTTDGQTPVAGHPIIARHIKKTIFSDCGFTCENRVDFLANKEVITLFTGLVCVHKDCALNAYTDDYIIRDVSTRAEVAINIYDSCKGKVCFYNNTTGLSCVVDSHAIGENDDNLHIRLQDRANDSKYYRYATNSGVRTVTAGDKYLSMVKAKWDYNIN